MTKGRLLASACALGLLAAPAVAATDSSGSMSPGPNDTMQHHPAHRATHAWHGSRQTDTSQNGEIDRLNEQSLAAARQNQPFVPGSGGGGASDTTSGSSGNKM